LKKLTLAGLVFLLTALTYINIPEVSATNEDLHVTLGLPETIAHEPMSENFTSNDYLNTTYPFTSDASGVSNTEGANPIYVLVFGDEEARNLWYGIPYDPYFLSWAEYGELQLERGDNALVANFGIDIRILGFLEWDSNDSLTSMYDLFFELEAETTQYLRQWYNGEWWSNYVDAIIGITRQSTPADPQPIAGLSSGDALLDVGRIFTLLKWSEVYWADDNLVQHEVSHLFYADDHQPNDPTCCAMADHRNNHFVFFIWEDWGLFPVFDWVPCWAIAYAWCTVSPYYCHQDIQQHSGWYPLRTLTISTSAGGTTSPTPGTCFYGNGTSVTVTASPCSDYAFCYWTLDGTIKFDNPITVMMNSNHVLGAYFGSGCPFLYVYNGSKYVCEGLLDIHNPEGTDVVTNHTLVSMPQRVDGIYLFRLVEHPKTHSYIDQVKIYAKLADGTTIRLPLIWAWHSQNGIVLPQLFFSDNWKTDILGANLNNGTSQSIDLKFLALPQNLKVASFIFQIEGNNPYSKE